MTIFIAFEDWLVANLPEVVSDLNLGATQNELQTFAASLDIVLPDDFRELYLWHNGQRMEVNTGPWYGLNFLALDRIKSEWDVWTDLLDKSSPESLTSLNSHSSSVPSGYVKQAYANKKWIPFAYDWGGGGIIWG